MKTAWRIVLIVALVLLAVAMAAATLWTALAFWFRLPFSELARGAAAGAFIIFGVTALVALIGRFRWRALAAFGAAFVAVLVWWTSIVPPQKADWVPEAARQVTGVVNGNILTLTDVRNFTWRSASDFTENWEKRTYDLSKLQTLDLFMSYWAGPEIAHTVLSFGFEGGQQLAWSIEVRYKKGGDYSPLADAFKTDTLVLLAADERDVIGLRTNVRGEDVQLYRLRVPPEEIRALLLGYVEEANDLASAPQFYNSITTNCTTTIVKILRLVRVTVPFDWRLVVNGYLPDYLYDHGLVDTRLPLAELRERSRITAHARQIGITPEFSAAIREEIPDPGK